MSNLKLFCFPYAGGSAIMYSKFKKYLQKSIEIDPVELAGRGKRFEEPFYESMEEAVNDVYEIIGDEFEKSHYALLGYSMGSWLAYGLYKKIVQNKRRRPEHIFLAAKEPPYVKVSDKILHVLDDEKFMKEIFNLGGTPKKLLEDKNFLDLFIPILRADYRITEMYMETSLKEKLNCPVTVFAGENDDISINDIKRWDEISNNGFSFYTLEGGHLFIQNNVEAICDIINSTLYSSSLAL
ncbi:MAG: putative thioesterase involved in non-ribosomal peptide biosynthesis [Firmicutes bacterium]|nr:putative thioesterase involved in non-ribosomal peptide biosynthesis [Bacillota bacterium]